MLNKRKGGTRMENIIHCQLGDSARSRSLNADLYKDFLLDIFLQ